MMRLTENRVANYLMGIGHDSGGVVSNLFIGDGFQARREVSANFSPETQADVLIRL
jgi:hypothetical protein